MRRALAHGARAGAGLGESATCCCWVGCSRVEACSRVLGRRLMHSFSEGLPCDERQAAAELLVGATMPLHVL